MSTRKFAAAVFSCCQYGSIQSEEGLIFNLAANCIPADVFAMDAGDYERFLAERRRLMAAKIRDYFLSL